MATTVSDIYGEVREGVDPVFRIVVSNDAQVMLVQADVTAIDLVVYQGNNTTAIYTAPALTFTAASNLFNTPQTDGWTEGGLGYNFKARVPASNVAMDGGETYRYEFKFTLPPGGPTAPIGLAVVRVKCVPATSQ